MKLLYPTPTDIFKKPICHGPKRLIAPSPNSRITAAAAVGIVVASPSGVTKVTYTGASRTLEGIGLESGTWVAVSTGGACLSVPKSAFSCRCLGEQKRRTERSYSGNGGTIPDYFSDHFAEVRLAKCNDQSRPRISGL